MSKATETLEPNAEIPQSLQKRSTLIEAMIATMIVAVFLGGLCEMD